MATIGQISNTERGLSVRTKLNAAIVEAEKVENKLDDLVDDTTPQLGGVLDTNSKAIQESKGVNVASTSNLPVLIDGNLFYITGTAGINSIVSGNWKAGSTIKLVFADVLIITHNASVTGDNRAIFLQSQSNYTTIADDVLELTYDGTYWREVNNLTKEGGGSVSISENGGTQYLEALIDVVTNGLSVLTNDSGVKNVLTLLLEAMSDLDTTGQIAGALMQRNTSNDGYEMVNTEIFSKVPDVDIAPNLTTTSDQISIIFPARSKCISLSYDERSGTGGTISIGTITGGNDIVNGASITASSRKPLTFVTDADINLTDNYLDLFVTITGSTALDLYFQFINDI